MKNKYVHNSRIDKFKRWTIDTVAGITYYQPILWGIEVYKGITLDDGLENRIIMTLFNVTIGSGIAAKYRDYFLNKISTKSDLSKIAATAFTQLTLYIPVYSAILFIKKTPIEKISDVLPEYALGTIVLALFYGSILEYFRKKFGKELYDRPKEKI